MVSYAPGLVPARFLTLLSHLTVLILILFSRLTVLAKKSLDLIVIVATPNFPRTILPEKLWRQKENVESCMTFEWAESDFNLKDNQLLIGLSISVVLIGIELIGFLSGVSMFMPLSALISIIGHFSGSLALSYFIFDQWDCNIFWWIFAFASAIPGLVEIITVIKVVALHKA